MENIKKIKKWRNEKKNEKKMKKLKRKRKDKKRKKKVWKKVKEGPKGYPPTPEMGPKIDFSHKNCQEKS